MPQQRQKTGLQLLSSKINEKFGIEVTAEQLQTHGWRSWQRPGNRNNYFQNEKLRDHLLKGDPAQAAGPVAAAAHGDGVDEPDTLLSAGKLDGATQQQQQQQDEDSKRTAHQAASGVLPSTLIWLPPDKEQQGLAFIADWLTKGVAKGSSVSFTAARLQQLGMRIVGAQARSPGARNFVWWPAVLREHALETHSFRHGAGLLLGRQDCRRVRGVPHRLLQQQQQQRSRVVLRSCRHTVDSTQFVLVFHGLGITEKNRSPAAARTAAGAVTGSPSSSWGNTAAARDAPATAAALCTSSNEPPSKRSRAAAAGAASAAGGGGVQAWQRDAAVELAGAAGEADNRAASAAEQLLAALEPVKPLVIWPAAAYNSLTAELRAGLPAAIASFIVAADSHITQLQRGRAALQQQAGLRQGHVRHYSLRQQGDSSSVSVAGTLLQAADAAVGWLQETEQQRLLRRAQQARLQRQQAEQRKLLPPVRGARRQQQQQQQLAVKDCEVPFPAGVTADVAAQPTAAAVTSSGLLLQARRQSVEAESAAMAAHDSCAEEDVHAVREKMRQLEAELAELQQREAQLACGSEQKL
ncbi:hypothetical protein COO60DRAFT_1692358 [Scenedesmus sp. NREL 46B-D3]|nr:hypothetical protein COO60DRAFT_1692358 [Scenedesmus sp. NREL 46B-D3]